jgi:osmoprotectant transport system permease protein
MGFIGQVIQWFADSAQWQGPDGIPMRFFEHVWYSLVSILIAALIALPIGIGIGHVNRGGFLAINASNVGRALPSLGIIVLVFSILGFGVVPALVTLIALAVPPIVTNSYAGIRSVDPAIRSAATGMGMTGWQVLWRVEVPIALPLILAGIRTSAIQVIATATIAAYIGLGGLGRYLIDGLAQQDQAQVLGGALLVAVFAIVVEVAFERVRSLVVPKGVQS